VTAGLVPRWTFLGKTGIGLSTLISSAQRRNLSLNRVLCQKRRRNHGGSHGLKFYAAYRPKAALHKTRDSQLNLSKMLNTKLFDAISSKVDLDDPAEQFLAWRFMIEALGRVTEQLPEIAKSAAAIANRFITGVATAEEVLEARVRLWEAIKGRDQSDEAEVLKIRTAICVLHPNDIGVPADTLEYFFAFWQRGGLGLPELTAAVENKYGI